MDTHLIVVRPFAGLSRGEMITEADRINDILIGEHAAHVVRVCTPSATATAARIGDNKEV